MKVSIKVPRMPRKSLTITTDFIRLDSAMKLAGIVGTGGLAKEVILAEAVKVNGEICTQRGKKLRPGDKFEFERTIYMISSAE